MLDFVIEHGVYTMPVPLEPPTKEIDVALLVFIERYATDLLKLDILTFFARNPDFCVSASAVAEHIGRSIQSVRPELGELVMLSILNQVSKNGQTLYQLTKAPHLREMTLKLSGQLAISTFG